MKLWPQFRSPLVWDFFAVSTYLTGSILFWYVGLVPDLADLRDRAKSRWTWDDFQRDGSRLARLFAALVSLPKGLLDSRRTRHAARRLHPYDCQFRFRRRHCSRLALEIFPPYFVAGAVFSGFAMVITIAVPLRAMSRLEDFITMRHIENMAKILLATGLMVTYSYLFEIFFAWYSANPFEAHIAADRATGVYAWLFWIQITCNVLVPQLLWWRKIRRNIPLLFIIALLVNVGMWVERYVIVVSSLHQDFMPSAWGVYHGTIWDYATLLGTFGLFLSLMFSFVRFLPSISVHELRESLPQAKVKEEA